MIKFFFIFIVFVIFSFHNLSSANIQNRIVLKVENEIVTSYEIKNKILTTLLMANEEINQKNIDRLKSQALDSLVQLKLKKIELSKYNIEKNRLKVNQYLNSISSNNIVELKKKFENNNLDFKLFVEEVEIQQKWQELIYRIYSNKIDIDQNSVNEDLQNILKEKSVVEELKISEIEILLNNDNSDLEKISNIKKLIKENGFDDTALKYSVSNSSSKKGLIGWINTKSLSDEVFEALKNLKVGETTSPIRKPNSVLFLKLNDKRSSSSKDINIINLRKNLVNRKKNELFNLYSKSHLSKLKNTSLIERK